MSYRCYKREKRLSIFKSIKKVLEGVVSKVSDCIASSIVHQLDISSICAADVALFSDSCRICCLDAIALTCTVFFETPV